MLIDCVTDKALLNISLFVVKFGGRQKLYMDFQLCRVQIFICTLTLILFKRQR